ncbi:cytochrome b/b6 domain-containing protein [Martelella lutilitoris]|uniref:Cytochrome b/b6 domain-containing protein n=1 Tax=Martelella lutilitoris TaxID=2583532 RepID=A0A7T7HLM1_9HYPH|nr:cytochrome b/b6 domain-containing protein [Martelella lutilitoris]QQM31395.1 cytochrome b/b6 domain-containing protein [Martelella lutilitoris]
MSDNANTGGGAKVAPPDPWDPLVRISHWTIAAAVIINGLLSKPGGTVHVWVGWIAMSVLAIRLGWGLLGPREARFSAFPPDPKAAVSHLLSVIRGKPREYPSHNPAGAMMVYALWAMLAVVIATGLIMTDAKSPITIAEERAAVEQGDWSSLANRSAGDDSDDSLAQSDIVKGVHETAANLMLILALIHVAGVAVESHALRRNLVRPMIKGPPK